MVIQKIFGSVFVLFGLGVILFSGLSVTGNAILFQTPPADIGLILSFALGLIGILLLTIQNK